MDIITIILVIVGIIQIALFVKIWIMTDDVKKIREMQDSSNLMREAKIAYLKGDKVNAKQKLDESFYHDIVAARENKFRAYYELYPAIKDKYTSLYKNMDLEALDIQNFESPDSIPN